MASRIAPSKEASRLKRPRAESRDHLAFIRSLPCVTCGDNTSTEAAHIRMADEALAKKQAGIGTKPDDAWTVPLCGECHREQHERGEEVFWRVWDKDPFVLALALWKYTGDHESAMTVIRNAR